jgi:hypothetical protein
MPAKFPGSRDGHPVTDEALLRDERRHSARFRSGLALSLVAALGDGVVMLLILVAMLALKHELVLGEKLWILMSSPSRSTRGDQNAAAELLTGQVCPTALFSMTVRILDEVHHRSIYPHPS